MPKSKNKNIFSLNRTPLKYILSALALALVVVGGLVAFYLSQQSQDLRQQAFGISYSPSVGVLCCINGVAYANRFHTDRACGQAMGEVVKSATQCKKPSSLPAATPQLNGKKGGVKCLRSEECQSGQCTQFRRCAYGRGE